MGMMWVQYGYVYKGDRMLENKLNFDFKINQQILKKISTIDSFKGQWDIIENKKNTYLKELKNIATIESIGSSTRIEGSKLSDDEIKDLLKNLKITKFTTRDQQEVVGYYEVLSLIAKAEGKDIIDENILSLYSGEEIYVYNDKEN